MKPRVPLFQPRPALIVAAALAAGVLLWGVCVWSIASQVGHPFPGFYYGRDRVVSVLTPEGFAGVQAGLRAGDRIVAVDGQHWREMGRLVREAGTGGSLTYTVERGSQRVQIAVPTMEFTRDMLLQFVPAWLSCGLCCLAVGAFVYARNPAGQLNRHLLLYLFLLSSAIAARWEGFLSQGKWTAYLMEPFEAAATVVGWGFFWSFPADEARRAFVARQRLLPAFAALGVLGVVCSPTLLLLASALDRATLWRLYTLSAGWGSFLLYGLGSVANKSGPMAQMALRKSNTPLVRRQAAVLLAGIGIALGSFLVTCWGPTDINLPPPIDTRLGALLTALYPLSVGYAILRYQLFDIRVVIRKGLVYSLLTATLTAAFLLLSLLSGYLFQAVAGRSSLFVALLPALYIAFLFQPARERIQTFVDRAFFRREVEARQALADFSRALSTLRTSGEVAHLVVDTLNGPLGAGKVYLWLRHGEENRFRAADGGSTPGPFVDESLAAWLARERRPLLVTPDARSPEAEGLRRAGADVALPLLSGDGLLGILALAGDHSGHLCSQDGLDLLSTLAHVASLALENAHLHEQRLAILQERLAQVTEAQEEERRRIARELHDALGSGLANLTLRLGIARRRLEQSHHPVAGELEELARLTQANIQDVRRLIYDLRPEALDELGLVPAVRGYASRFQSDHGLDVALATGEGGNRLPAPLETALFRVVQEALANVARHADARRVQIALKWDERLVLLRIGDDGHGFDPQEVSARAKGGRHLGLSSMRERIAQFGGQLEVQSAPRRGTVVTALVPLPAEDTGAWTKSPS